MLISLPLFDPVIYPTGVGSCEQVNERYVIPLHQAALKAEPGILIDDGIDVVHDRDHDLRVISALDVRFDKIVERVRQAPAILVRQSENFVASLPQLGSSSIDIKSLTFAAEDDIRRQLKLSGIAAGLTGSHAGIENAHIFAPGFSNSASGRHPSPVRTVNDAQRREGEGVVT